MMRSWGNNHKNKVVSRAQDKFHNPLFIVLMAVKKKLDHKKLIDNNLTKYGHMDNKAISFARGNAQRSSLLMGHIVLPDKEGVLLRICRDTRQFHGI